jgi:hypothetical protein
MSAVGAVGWQADNGYIILSNSAYGINISDVIVVVIHH